MIQLKSEKKNVSKLSSSTSPPPSPPPPLLTPNPNEIAFFQDVCVKKNSKNVIGSNKRKEKVKKEKFRNFFEYCDDVTRRFITKTSRVKNFF